MKTVGKIIYLIKYMIEKINVPLVPPAPNIPPKENEEDPGRRRKEREREAEEKMRKKKEEGEKGGIIDIEA